VIAEMWNYYQILAHSIQKRKTTNRKKKYPEDIGGHNKCILCQRQFQNYKAFRLMKYIARYNEISCNRYQEILDRNERND